MCATAPCAHFEALRWFESRNSFPSTFEVPFLFFLMAFFAPTWALGLLFLASTLFAMHVFVNEKKSMSQGIHSAQAQKTQPRYVPPPEAGKRVIEVDFLTSAPRFKYWVGPMLESYKFGNRPGLPIDARNIHGQEPYKYVYDPTWFPRA